MTTETTSSSSSRGRSRVVAVLDRAHVDVGQLGVDACGNAIATTEVAHFAQPSRERDGAGLGTFAPAVRICLVYDCLFPYTVGGAERWYRNLAERLAADGHEVTYLTLRQWERGRARRGSGRRCRRRRAADGALQRPAASAAILPPLVFGAGVLWHLLRHGRRYDVVHTCSFPYFSLLAAALVRPLRPLPARRRLVRGVERARTGASTSAASAARRAGWCSALCAARAASARSASRSCTPRGCARRACAARSRCCAALYDGPLAPPAPVPAEPLVVFAGRHIPEKRVPAVVPAVGAGARERIPELRGADPRRRPGARRRCSRRSPRRARGRRRGARLRAAGDGRATIWRARCACMLPSRREGYGLVVVEAAVARHAERASCATRQRRRRAGRRGRQRLRRRVAVAGGRWPPRSCASRRRARRCALDGRRGSPRNAAQPLARRLAGRASPRATRPARARVARGGQLAPRAPT